MQTTQDLVAPQLGRYEIDPGASTVSFRTRHMFGLGGVRGTFAIRTGMIDVTEPLSDSSIHVEIDAASFNTGHGQRDSTVRSRALLDVGRHPVITFIVAGVDGPNLVGTLTVRDVSRPLTVAVDSCVVSPGAFNARATTRVDRYEWGVTGYRGLAGRYLQMTVDVRCVRQ